MTPSCISNVLQNQFQRDFSAISARFQSSMLSLSCPTQKDRIAVHLQQRLSPKIIADVEEIIELSERSEID